MWYNIDTGIFIPQRRKHSVNRGDLCETNSIASGFDGQRSKL